MHQQQQQQSSSSSPAATISVVMRTPSSAPPSSSSPSERSAEATGASAVAKKRHNGRSGSGAGATARLSLLEHERSPLDGDAEHGLAGPADGDEDAYTTDSASADSSIADSSVGIDSVDFLISAVNSNDSGDIGASSGLPDSSSSVDSDYSTETLAEQQFYASERSMARTLRVTRMVFSPAMQLAAVYFFEYMVSVGFASKANPHADPKDWWATNAYELLAFCYQVGVFFARSSVSVIQIRSAHMHRRQHTAAAADTSRAEQVSHDSTADPFLCVLGSLFLQTHRAADAGSSRSIRPLVCSCHGQSRAASSLARSLVSPARGCRCAARWLTDSSSFVLCCTLLYVLACVVATSSIPLSHCGCSWWTWCWSVCWAG